MKLAVPFPYFPIIFYLNWQIDCHKYTKIKTRLNFVFKNNNKFLLCFGITVSCTRKLSHFILLISLWIRVNTSVAESNNHKFNRVKKSNHILTFTIWLSDKINYLSNTKFSCHSNSIYTDWAILCINQKWKNTCIWHCNHWLTHILYIHRIFYISIKSIAIANERRCKS